MKQFTSICALYRAPCKAQANNEKLTPPGMSITMKAFSHKFCANERNSGAHFSQPHHIFIHDDSDQR